VTPRLCTSLLLSSGLTTQDHGFVSRFPSRSSALSSSGYCRLRWDLGTNLIEYANRAVLNPRYTIDHTLGGEARGSAQFTYSLTHRKELPLHTWLRTRGMPLYYERDSDTSSTWCTTPQMVEDLIRERHDSCLCIQRWSRPYSVTLNDQ